ncbi:hypothetical protein [Runella slithyformis]|uniref:ParB/Sulfiredoxin domain-containing protein n=1 Tax=Runella slithyformis (strain ATCC 29530 / DSM 19594 / LMG 11500 / NCIMB 11436 / LSU 4) TaxID=761193 RepID=A0A7U4E919_RUNSL|nr:hypothetical protein [Runella slithyformis]AEI51988.1 hypothetical protein Runsl_5700 [Runella slithyformis DSM 19594]
MAKDFMSGIRKTTSQLPFSPFSEVERIKKQITILEELRQFITPLTNEEYSVLESNILNQGCKDPLTVWETTRKTVFPDDTEERAYVLIDGHNRYTICQKYDLDFKIVLLSFKDIEEVKDYMIDFQLGRRNLNPEQMSFFRGLRYNREKVGKGKYDREEGGMDISKHLAEEYKVSQRTIKNDGNFAKGIAKFIPRLQQEVLSGTTALSRTHIQELGKRDDIAQGTLTTLERIEPAESSVVPTVDELSIRKKEIARLAVNLSSKTDYSLLLEKVKELKNFI